MSDPLAFLKDISSSDIRKKMAEVESENQIYNQQLRERAKEPKDLVQSIDLEVTYATTTFKQHRHTPISEMVLGGESNYYDTGMSERLELRVISDCGIQRILFDGAAPIVGGDLIRAYILKGEQESFRTRLGLKDSETVWVDREYKSLEVALEIEKLRHGKAIAKYVSANSKIPK